MSKTKRRMPNKKEILKYWQNLNHDLDDVQFVENQCFACGSQSALQRCHILPKWQGGNDTVDNLHLLCFHCHFASENLTGDKYWLWYEYKINNEFDFGFKRMYAKAKALQLI